MRSFSALSVVLVAFSGCTEPYDLLAPEEKQKALQAARGGPGGGGGGGEYDPPPSSGPSLTTNGPVLMDLQAAQQRYPDGKILAPPGATRNTSWWNLGEFYVSTSTKVKLLGFKREMQIWEAQGQATFDKVDQYFRLNKVQLKPLARGQIYVYDSKKIDIFVMQTQ